MTTAIRQTVQVNAEGVIEIRAPGLTPGQQAEVIVLVETAEEAAARRTALAERLAAFFKQVQALPTSQAISEEEIAAEIAAYRAGQ